MHQTNRRDPSRQSGSGHLRSRAAEAGTPTRRDADLEPSRCVGGFRSPSKDTSTSPHIASISSSSLPTAHISCLPRLGHLRPANTKPSILSTRQSGGTNEPQTLCWSRTETDLYLCERAMADTSPIFTATAALMFASPSQFHPRIPPTPVRARR